MGKTASEVKSPGLSCLLQQAAGAVADLGAEFVHHQSRLADLSNRLAEGRFHLAVLGQFKRGKSTLLNALVGEKILPVGVVPLTAAPTFIQFGPRRLGRSDCRVLRGEPAPTSTNGSRPNWWTVWPPMNSAWPPPICSRSPAGPWDRTLPWKSGVSPTGQGAPG